MKQASKLLVGLVLTCLALVGTLQTAQANTFGAQSFTLDNGLKVVVIPNHRIPVVTHMIWFQAGSADENPNHSGIAHFLEHLMFKGTKNVGPGEYSTRLRAMGAEENAFTSYDYTAYYATIAKEYLPEVMKLEADRWAHLAPPEKDVLSEREVILEERSQRTDNDPKARYFETLLYSLFPNHPYGRPIIGWRSDMEKLTWADGIAFRTKFYHAGQAYLILSGDITIEEAKHLAHKYYSHIPHAEPTPRNRPHIPPLPGKVVLEAKDATLGEDILMVGLRVPSYAQDRKTALGLSVLADHMSSGAATKLYQSLVVKNKYATTISMSYDGERLDAGVMWLTAVPSVGVSLETLLEKVQDELDKLANEGITESELQESVTRMQYAAIHARDSVAGPAMIIGRLMATGQSLKEIESWPQDITKVTPADVKILAKTYLTRDAWAKTAPVIGLMKGRPDAAKQVKK